MEHKHALGLLVEYATSLQLNLSVDRVKAFETYLQHLQIWNKSTNLTTITSPEAIVVKHFIDSLAALRAENMTHGANLLDVGSGGGFPGIPLKIARPDLSVTLVEPAPKKASFLHFTIGLLRLENIRVFTGTFEHLLTGKDPELYDYATTRALKYDFVLRRVLKVLSPGGKVLLYTSKPLETIDIGWLLERQLVFQLPESHGMRTVSVLRAAS